MKRIIKFQIKLLVFIIKLLTKIIIGHNPFIYKLLNKLKITSHGKMKDTKEIYELFNYYNKNLIAFNIDLNELNNRGDFLEVGPGDSLGLSYVFFKTGFKNAYAIDKDNFLTKFGKNSLNKLDKRILRGFSLAKSINKNVSNTFLYDSINYLTNGIHSLNEVKDKSISLILSNAAFEHIDKKEVDGYFQLFRKKLCPDGIFILRIDLKDHLVGDFFNHLVPEKYWESNLFKRGSHYTNRIKTNEFKNIISKNKLKIIILKNEKYSVTSFFNNDYSINLNSILNSQKVPSSIMIIGKK